MAGSLTLRLTQTDPDESRHIPFEYFLFGVQMIVVGRHTRLEVQNFYSMTPSDIVQFNTLMDKIESGSQTIKHIRIQYVHSIMSAWEMDPVPGPYDTEDKIETELSNIDLYPI